MSRAWGKRAWRSKKQPRPAGWALDWEANLEKDSVMREAPTHTSHRAVAPVAPPPAPRPLSQQPARRQWLRQAAGAAAAACVVLLWPWRQALAKKIGIKLDQVAALKEVGGSQVLTLKALDGPLLLVRQSETEVRAINPMCTHKKCLVRYNTESKKLHCKCHKSQFELTGKVLGGPAKKDLATYPASLTQDQIVISLPDA